MFEITWCVTLPDVGDVLFKACSGIEVVLLHIMCVPMLVLYIKHIFLLHGMNSVNDSVLLWLV